MTQQQQDEDVDERIDSAVEAAKMEFWREIADQFPDAESGDFPPDATREIDEAMFRAVMRWVDYNVPGADVSGLEG